MLLQSAVYQNKFKKTMRKIFFLLTTFSIVAMYIFTSCGARRRTSITDDYSVIEQGVVFNGVRWATRNVDAPGTFVANPEDAGMHFQWNRQKGWRVTDSDVEGWQRSVSLGTAWERNNDPCPEGWRVPTNEELISLGGADCEWVTLYGVYGRLFGTAPNQIFLPAAGWRYYNDGANHLRGVWGYYWSNTQYDHVRAYKLGFSNRSVSQYASWHSSRFSVRCVAVNATLVSDEGVVIDGIRWATHNVDAPGTFTANRQDPGMFYQWNRNIAGWDNSTPEGMKWEAANDPCPPGWRIPTANEIDDFLNADNIPTTRNGVRGRLFGIAPNQIFLPAAGVRGAKYGNLFNVGEIALYWSSSPFYNVAVYWSSTPSYSDSEKAINLMFGRSNATVNWNERAIGGSIRCVADEQPATFYLGEVDTPATFVVVDGVLKIDNSIASDESVVISGIRWATRNVNTPGTFTQSPESFGMFFQWNRKKGWTATDRNIEDWDSTNATGAKWSAQSDPCPPGWRVPTRYEIYLLARAGSRWTSINGSYGRFFGTAPNQIFLPAAFGDGYVIQAHHWSSTQYENDDEKYAISLMFCDNSVHLFQTERSNAFPVRCVAIDETLVVEQGVAIDGIRWATRNVNAPGTFVPTPEDFGMFFQWGSRRGWADTGGVTGWSSRLPESATCWETKNDPCPPGWRLPTLNEWQFLNSANSKWTNVNGVYGLLFGVAPNQIFLPAAGWRQSGDGNRRNNNRFGNYWSSTTNLTMRGWNLMFGRGSSGVSSTPRETGFSIRCVSVTPEVEKTLFTPRRISVLTGALVLEIRREIERFQDIVISYRDESIALEIRRRDGYYFINNHRRQGMGIYHWLLTNIVEHPNLEQALTEWLRGYLEIQESISRRRHERLRQSLPEGMYWSAFEQEDKVRRFISIINELIDDELLDSPFGGRIVIVD